MQPETLEDRCSGGPSPWVERFIDGVRQGGRILDVACGAGRHMRLALQRGYQVTAVDRDLARVRDLYDATRCELVAADLEGGAPPPFRGRTFDGVIVTNYLWRPLLPDIVSAVAPDGLLIYETFARGNERLGKPRNPDYLLEPDELLQAVSGRLLTIAYEHALLSDPPRLVERIAAVGRQHAWIIDPTRRTQIG